MNNRIKEIALNCGAIACGGYITPSGSVNMVWSSEGGIDTSKVNLEKFAELIIRDVVSIAMEQYDENLPWGNVEQIKDHFGIKDE